MEELYLLSATCIHLFMTDVHFCFLYHSGDLLRVLDVSNDEKKLPTTYGRLQPPLGVHRLKVCSFHQYISLTFADFDW